MLKLNLFLEPSSRVRRRLRGGLTGGLRRASFSSGDIVVRNEFVAALGRPNLDVSSISDGTMMETDAPTNISEIETDPEDRWLYDEMAGGSTDDGTLNLEFDEPYINENHEISD